MGHTRHTRHADHTTTNLQVIALPTDLSGALLRRVSRQKVPALGLTVSFAVMLIGVVVNYFVPKQAFLYVTSVATVCGLFIWGMIVYAHVSYRRYVRQGRLPASDFQLPGAPAANWLVLVFLALVLVLMTVDEDTRLSLYMAPVWIAIMVIGYYASRSRHLPPASHLAPAGTYATSATGSGQRS